MIYSTKKDTWLVLITIFGVLVLIGGSITHVEIDSAYYAIPDKRNTYLKALYFLGKELQRS